LTGKQFHFERTPVGVKFLFKKLEGTEQEDMAPFTESGQIDAALDIYDELYRVEQ
jgi:hypothetical protein